MRELFDTLKTRSYALTPVLLDTCFLVHTFSHADRINKLYGLCDRKNVGITSFSISEFLNIQHKVPEQVRSNIRKFLHSSPDLFTVNINVNPGEWDNERSFVNTIEPDLLKHVHDPSDAVLIATAISMRADVLTRDKHHLYTADLENFLRKYKINVWNKMHD